MSLLLTIHTAATWALIGLIWTIQLVHYPLFAQVGNDTFLMYHRRHTTQITWVVAPLMFLELATAATLVFNKFNNPWLLASLGPLAFNWFSTWRVQIPLHTKLAAGFDPQVHSRLVSTNWGRTTAWTSRGLCLIMLTA